MPSKHHRGGLIAIELYRWFTVEADVSQTANTHLQNPDVKRRKKKKKKGDGIGKC